MTKDPYINPKSPHYFPNKKGTPKKILKKRVSQRRSQVIKLQAQGLTIPEIAKKLGVSKQTVYNDRRIRLKEQSLVDEDLPIVRKRTIGKFEHMLNHWWPKAHNDLAALDRAITLIEKIARYSGVAPATHFQITSKSEHTDKQIRHVRIELVAPNGHSEIIEQTTTDPRAISLRTLRTAEENLYQSEGCPNPFVPQSAPSREDSSSP